MGGRAPRHRPAVAHATPHDCGAHCACGAHCRCGAHRDYDEHRQPRRRRVDARCFAAIGITPPCGLRDNRQKRRPSRAMHHPLRSSATSAGNLGSSSGSLPREAAQRSLVDLGAVSVAWQGGKTKPATAAANKTADTADLWRWRAQSARVKRRRARGGTRRLDNAPGGEPPSAQERLQ